MSVQPRLLIDEGEGLVFLKTGILVEPGDVEVADDSELGAFHKLYDDGTRTPSILVGGTSRPSDVAQPRILSRPSLRAGRLSGAKSTTNPPSTPRASAAVASSRTSSESWVRVQDVTPP